MSRLRAYAIPLLAAVLVVAGRATAAASPIFITAEGKIQDQGLLNWSALGPVLTNIDGPFVVDVPNVAGLTLTGALANGTTFQRRDQTTGYWSGNFGVGEELLWTKTAQGPMNFTFNSGIAGFGVQIQANFFGPFTARIEAFDANDLSLGAFTLPGQSVADVGDDSAIFIGILSRTQNIRRINLSVPTAHQSPEDFAINSPRIQASVPEPATLLLVGIGLAGGAVRRYRHRA